MLIETKMILKPVEKISKLYKNDIYVNQPGASAFVQQRLKAYYPFLNVDTLVPGFILIGLLFVPVGIGLLWYSEKIRYFSLDYTYCKQYNGNGTTCFDYILYNANESCECRIDFKLEFDIPKQVLMYYGLTNFYQNHRNFYKSKDERQLSGILDVKPSYECFPYRYDSDGKPIAPCGALANSFFSDELEIYTESGNKIPLLRTNIAWLSDRLARYNNPPGEDLREAFENFSRPKAWRKNIWDLDPDDAENNGFKNEDFIIWMKPAAFSTFKKLYRRLNHNIFAYRYGLRKGLYTLVVQYNFDVSGNGGTKRLILTHHSLIGLKNPFLGIAYTIVGGILVLIGVTVYLVHLKYVRGFDIFTCSFFKEEL